MPHGPYLLWPYQKGELGFDYPVSRYQLIIRSLLSFVPEGTEREKVRRRLGYALTVFEVMEI